MIREGTPQYDYTVRAIDEGKDRPWAMTQKQEKWSARFVIAGGVWLLAGFMLINARSLHRDLWVIFYRLLDFHIVLVHAMADFDQDNICTG